MQDEIEDVLSAHLLQVQNPVMEYIRTLVIPLKKDVDLLFRGEESNKVPALRADLYIDSYVGVGVEEMNAIVDGKPCEELAKRMRE